MKCGRWLVVAVATLALAVTGSGSARADATTDVTILQQAQYVTEVVVSVALHVTCGGGPAFGVVDVTVEQEPPETQSTTIGSGVIQRPTLLWLSRTRMSETNCRRLRLSYQYKCTWSRHGRRHRNTLRGGLT